MIKMNRASGILLGISSLPSEYGIGSIGKPARDFADFLCAAGQKYWQILPAGQTGYGDSPYQSFSSFAGNPYFIDIDELVSQGLLTKAEAETAKTAGEKVDYGALYANSYSLLESAYERGRGQLMREILAFYEKNAAWLPDYALFMALSEHFGGKPWTEWDDDIRSRESDAMAKYRSLLGERTGFWIFVQYLFFTQWDKMKKYVNSLGIKIIGDLPVYVAANSADIWASPAEFQLDRDLRCKNVAGVPPDYFSEDGQLWGNPLYDWEHMKKNGYIFWKKRLGGALRLYDTVRLDHFRGFASYWSIPAGEKTAKNGKWCKGGGIDFINAMKAEFPDAEIIAEDLGVLGDDVRTLLRQSGFPGMKVLEFAFDGDEPSDYLPHRYERNCVCYLGTHDNDTALGWLSSAKEETAEYAARYFGLNKEEGEVWGLIRGGMASCADLFIVQMQDYLGLDSSTRMNTPGEQCGNWSWRMKKGAATPALAKKIFAMAKMYERA